MLIEIIMLLKITRTLLACNKNLRRVAPFIDFSHLENLKFKGTDGNDTFYTRVGAL